MNQWIAELIGGAQRKALPIMTTPGIELVGAAPLDVFRSGKLQYEAIRALTERVPTAAALTMMDLSVEAEAFGCRIKFGEQEDPTVSGAIAHDRDGVDAMTVPEVGTARTGETLTAARLCAENISDRPTLGGMIGPFSLGGRLLDMSKMMLLAAMEPETVHALLEKVAMFLIDYAKAIKATGCHGIVMAEPAAGLISAKMCQEFSSNYIKRIVDAVKDDSFAFVLHNCGKTERMVVEMLSTGASALHVGNAVDIRKILDQTPPRIPVMGNLDPVGVFRMETPENVFKTTSDLLEATKDYPNFVLSSGCDIPPGTPMKNVESFFDALNAYNSRD